MVLLVCSDGFQSRDSMETSELIRQDGLAENF
jgi:hypothetical protein